MFGVNFVAFEKRQGYQGMKYQTELLSVANCPPQACSPQNIRAYRFVYDPLDSTSFLPQGIKDPARAHKETRVPVKCSLYALSMFTTEQKAIEKYRDLKKFVKNIDKTIGSHLAEGQVTTTDGTMSTPNRKGHFDVFEYSGVDFTNSFSISTDLSGV
ncbi:hypothetical protein [Vibrio splendidus]|uniref:hypothetical protein n=1 Tax=Vibrio splendidus TaxID=29497 RepID=UPI0021173B12|nr:hypothetical protein [Vibrio splendidus]MCQ8870101.1 hypothetical protein [Vibrio splendidus]